MRTHSLAANLGAVLLVAGLAGSALAHGGSPQVKDIRFPPVAGGAAWLMDELGLLTEGPEGFTWLCDDSVSPLVGFDTVVPVDATTWVLATRAGAFLTLDRGCSYVQVPGPLTEHVLAGLLPHPDHPGEMVTATATLGILNDVYRSVDGGQTWQAAGLESTTRIRSFVRSEADPEVLYASHGAGISRSDDGGASFHLVALGPPAGDLPGELPVRPEEFRFLATSPINRLEAFGVIERFPKSLLVHTDDGGDHWTVRFGLEDSPDSMVYTQDGQKLLFSSPFLGLFRSVDGGQIFDPVPAPGIMGCLTREPGSDRIWACGRGRPLAWVAAMTPDLGDHWEVKLAQYADLVGTWACPPGSATALACSRQCPPADPMCVPPDAGVTPDLGVTADAGLDAGVPDMGVVTDQGPQQDASLSTQPADGCGISDRGGAAFAWLLGLWAVCRRRF